MKRSIWVWVSLIFFLLSRIYLFTSDSVDLDVHLCFWPAARDFFSRHLIPYQQFHFPYPPGALFFILLPGIWSQTASSYHAAFRWEMFTFDLLTFYLLSRFLSKRLAFAPKQIALSLGLYSALSIPLQNLLYERFDIVVATLFVFVVHFYDENKRHQIFLYGSEFIGIVIKIIPMFWFPFSFLLLRKFKKQSRVIPLLVFVIPLAVSVLGYLILTADSPFLNLKDQWERGIQVESLWASPLVLARSLGVLDGVRMVFEYGAYHLVGDAVPFWYLEISKYVAFLLLGALFLTRFFSIVPKSGSIDHFQLVFAAVLVTIAFGRVFSPQFLIWCLPGFAIEGGRRNSLLYAAAVLVLFALTPWIYPAGLEGFPNFDISVCLATAVRNAVFLALCVASLRDVLREPSLLKLHRMATV